MAAMGAKARAGRLSKMLLDSGVCRKVSESHLMVIINFMYHRDIS